MSAKAEAVKAAILANPNHSDRRIAAGSGVSHGTVAAIRRKHFPNQKKRVGRDGKTRVAPLAANADLLGELDECLSRAEAVLLKIKGRLSVQRSAETLSFEDIWKGKQPLLGCKTRPTLVKHLRAQAKRIDYAFGDVIYRH